jgi:porin
MFMTLRLKVLAALIAAVLVGVSTSPTPTRGDDTRDGDVWSRDRLTGDWGGLRSQLEERGVELRGDVVSVFQGIASGGRDEDSGIGGSADLFVDLDSEKMGLWPGGFLTIFAEAQFGDNVIRKTGALTPSNTDALFPLPDEDKVTLSNVVFAQFLTESFGVFGGKVETLEGDLNAFAGGRGKDQFLNSNFVFNPVTLLAIPYSALGGGLLYLLPDDMGTINVSVLDPGGQPDEAGFDDAFGEGVVISAEGRVAVELFERPGHQSLGFVVSTADFNSLGDLDRLLLPPGAVVVGKESSSWAVYYNFDHYLYVESDGEQGVGVFGRFGWADRDSNPIERFYSIGIGGQGIVPGRDQDSFGVGYYYQEVSNQVSNFVATLADLDDGQGGEIWYSIELTPWMHLTLDFQVIESTGPFDTAIVGGLRGKVDF